MGWGCPSEDKRVFLQPACEHYDCENGSRSIDILQKVKAVEIDVNAVARQMLISGSTLTPRHVASRLYINHVACCPSAEMVVFAFDSPDLVPEERNAFHQNVRYAQATRGPVVGEILAEDGRLYKYDQRPISADEVRQITIDYVPGSWERVWNSKEGKKKMWDVIAIALEDFLNRLAHKSAIFIIDTQRDGKKYIPAAWREKDINNNCNWGEADQKVMQYSLVHKKDFSPVLISTIDFDMPLQCLVHDTRDIYIRIGYVYSTPDESHTFYSKGMANKVYLANKMNMERPRRCMELINCSTLVNKFPSRAHRLEGLFWCFSAGGGDYTKGLCSYGLNTAKCLQLLLNIQNPKNKSFIKEGYLDEETPMSRCVQIDINLMIRRMISLGPTRIRKKCIKEFNMELQKLFFCVLYFIGWDPRRTRGGPLLSTDHLFSENVHSVMECFSGKFIFKKVYYTEVFPEDTQRMPPTFNYSNRIAEIIDTKYNFLR